MDGVTGNRREEDRAAGAGANGVSTDGVGTDGVGTDGVVLMGEQSGATHYVPSAEVWAAATGRPPRALCRRTFRPAALVAPLARLCPACADAHREARPGPRRRRPCRSLLPGSILGRSRRRS